MFWGFETLPGKKKPPVKNIQLDFKKVARIKMIFAQTQYLNMSKNIFGFFKFFIRGKIAPFSNLALIEKNSRNPQDFPQPIPQILKNIFLLFFHWENHLAQNNQKFS